MDRPPSPPQVVDDRSALLVIDMQRDFLPALDGIGGALEVGGGDQIVPGINALAARFDHVILTQDWHPRGHISFAQHPPTSTPSPTPSRPPTAHNTSGPTHCVQATPGADLHPALDIPHAELILRKGFRRDIDSYSAFTENDHATPTGLAGYLRERGIRRLYLCGVAYDYCVGFSAIAARPASDSKPSCSKTSPAASRSPLSTKPNATFATLGIQRISSISSS